MIRLLLVGLILIAVTRISVGHQDAIAHPTRVEFTFPKIGIVTLVMDGEKVSELSLKKGTTRSSVRNEDLAGISHLQLETIQIRFGQYYASDLDGVTYDSVCIRFGTKDDIKFGEYPEVCFTFHDSEYSHRDVWRATDANGGREGRSSVSPSQWKGRKNLEPSIVIPTKGPIELPKVEPEPAGP